MLDIADRPNTGSPADAAKRTASGTIRILTGFSAAGKTTISREMTAASRGRAVRHLIEDRYYGDPRLPVQALGSFAGQAAGKEPCKDLVRTFYNAAHELLINDALRFAREGQNVLVDICPGQPDDFFALLKATKKKAEAQESPLSIAWLTCSDARRRDRIEKRGTLFDRTLVENPDYLALVAAVEDRMRREIAPVLPVEIVFNDGDDPDKSAAAPKLSMKNIPGLAPLAALIHVGVLKTPTPKP